MRRAALVLVVLIAPALAGGEGDLSAPAKKLYDHAMRTARASRLHDRDKEKLSEELADLSDADLLAVVQQLRAVVDPLKSLDGVRALLSNAYLERAYGKEAAKRFPDLLDRREKQAAEDRLRLLGDSMMLEDLRLADELAVEDAGSKLVAVRGRSALALGSLFVWGQRTKEVRWALKQLLDDGDPAVRAMAVRAGFRARFDPAYPWAVAHLDDGETGTMAVDGEKETVRPGAEALTQLKALTRLDIDLTWEDFHPLSADGKDAIRKLFDSWWEEKGGHFPMYGYREAVFRPVPADRKSEILANGDTELTFQFWAGLDRTRIRLVVEEIQLAATGLYDWNVNFHARYMAQGMRVDDGEAWIRHQIVGSAWVLARKAIGCYVLTFQPLFDGRMKIGLEFYDPLR